jgi:hypothetical protein
MYHQLSDFVLHAIAAREKVNGHPIDVKWPGSVRPVDPIQGAGIIRNTGTFRTHGGINGLARSPF